MTTASDITEDERREAINKAALDALLVEVDRLPRYVHWPLIAYAYAAETAERLRATFRR